MNETLIPKRKQANLAALGGDEIDNRAWRLTPQPRKNAAPKTLSVRRLYTGFMMSIRDWSPSHWIYYLFCLAFFLMPMGTSPFTALGICILLVWIFSGEFYRTRGIYLREPWFLPVAAIVLLAWLGLIWSPEPLGLGVKFAKKTYYWLYALAAVSAVSIAPVGTWIKALLGGLFLNAVVGFLQVLHVVPRFTEWGATGYTGFSGGYNTLAILLVLGVLAASFYYKRAADKRKKCLYTAAMLVYLAHIVILESRGGYLTMAVLAPLALHNILERKGLLAVALAFTVLAIILLLSPVAKNRITRTAEDLSYYYNSESEIAFGKKYSEKIDRIYMWRWAIDLFMKHPFLGVGTGGYKEAILAEGGDRGIDHPHNNILHVAVSYGVVGLLVFGWFFWILLREGWRHRHLPSGFFVLASTLVILVGGLTNTHILDAGGASLLAVTTGLMSVIKEG